MSSSCLHVWNTFFGMPVCCRDAGFVSLQYRNSNDPLIQCDSLCCYSTLGQNCWITQFLMDVHFLETLFVFVVTAVCSAVGVCLLLLKLWVLIPLDLDFCVTLVTSTQALRKSKMPKHTRPRSGVCKERCVWVRWVFYLQEPLYREQQITLHGGCTSGYVCLCLSWLLAQLCCGGHNAHTYIWVKYSMCICEHCIGQEREDINVHTCECSELVRKS